MSTLLQARRGGSTRSGPARTTGSSAASSLLILLGADGRPGRLRRRTRAQLSALATPAHRPRRRRRVGVMGGTFDPIHHGHLVAASEVQAWFDLDEVVFVPTGEPWQKSDREVSPAEHRYLMTVIATASNPRFYGLAGRHRPRRADVHRSTRCATCRPRMPDAELYFITGADALAEIFTWRDADELFELAHFVGCTRPGYTMDAATLAAIPADRVTMVEIPALAISLDRLPRAQAPRASRSGTSSPTASSSTSPSTTSTPQPKEATRDRHRPRRRARRRRRPRGRPTSSASRSSPSTSASSSRSPTPS